MAIVFADLLTILQKHIGDSSNTTFATQCLNQAQREVRRARRWPEAMGARKFVNTVAAYQTGTVAVTANSTTVTLTGGTWPSDVATGSYRFALSVSDPWYTVATRSSDSVILLAEAYVGDTDASTTYVAYKSHYALDATVDRVEEAWLHRAGSAPKLVNAATDQAVSDFQHYPSGVGVPTHFLPIERSSSTTRQILLGPETPDDVYRIEYTFKTKSTDGTYNLDESRWPVVMAKALALAYQSDNYERSLAEERRYQALLRDEWVAEGEVETQSVRVGESRVRFPGGDDWISSLMGFGRVADPS